MFTYNIGTRADDDVFDKQCLALEKHIPDLIKKDLLVDVDASKVQYYRLGSSAITVHNDRYVGAVYINSEIELEQYFK